MPDYSQGNEALARVNDVSLMPVAQMKMQLSALHELMRDILRADVDYGSIIPGQKPTLLKPGAEKICTQFGLDPQYEVVNMTVQDDYIDYDIKCILYSRKTGVRLGSGLGSCNSREEKYMWRKAIHPDEYDSTFADRKREKIRLAKGGSTWKEKQVRQNPFDVKNTIEKMACKRALVAGVLNVTNASEIFTQDIEDLPPETVGNGEKAQPSAKPITEKMTNKVHVLLNKLGVPKDEATRREFAAIKLVLPKEQVPHLHGLTMEQGSKLIDILDEEVKQSEAGQQGKLV